MLSQISRGFRVGQFLWTCGNTHGRIYGRTKPLSHEWEIKEDE